MSISGVGSGFGYVGPNYNTVAADNARAQSAGGFNGGFVMADILTPEDKAVTGYNPEAKGPGGVGVINEAAIAVARDRYNGTLQGPMTPDYLKGLTQRTSLDPDLIQQMMENLSHYNDTQQATAPAKGENAVDFMV